MRPGFVAKGRLDARACRAAEFLDADDTVLALGRLVAAIRTSPRLPWTTATARRPHSAQLQHPRGSPCPNRLLASFLTQREREECGLHLFRQHLNLGKRRIIERSGNQHIQNRIRRRIAAGTPPHNCQEGSHLLRQLPDLRKLLRRQLRLPRSLAEHATDGPIDPEDEMFHGRCYPFRFASATDTNATLRRRTANSRQSKNDMSADQRDDRHPSRAKATSDAFKGLIDSRLIHGSRRPGRSWTRGDFMRLSHGTADGRTRRTQDKR